MMKILNYVKINGRSFATATLINHESDTTETLTAVLAFVCCRPDDAVVGILSDADVTLLWNPGYSQSSMGAELKFKASCQIRTESSP